MNIHARFTRIAARTGPFNKDQLGHCSGTVEVMGIEADAALVELREDDLGAVVEYLLGATELAQQVEVTHDGVEARLRAWLNGEAEL